MSKQFTTNNLQHETVLADGTKLQAREVDAFEAHVKSVKLPVAWVHRSSVLGSAPLAKFEGLNAVANAQAFADRQNAAYAPHGYYRAEVTVK